MRTADEIRTDAEIIIDGSATKEPEAPGKRLAPDVLEMLNLFAALDTKLVSVAIKLDQLSEELSEIAAVLPKGLKHGQ